MAFEKCGRRAGLLNDGEHLIPAAAGASPRREAPYFHRAVTVFPGAQIIECQARPAVAHGHSPLPSPPLTCGVLLL